MTATAGAGSTKEMVSEVLPPEESRWLFDQHARRLVGMSGEGFRRRWDAGGYRGRILDEDQETRKIAFLALLIPFGRS